MQNSTQIYITHLAAVNYKLTIRKFATILSLLLMFWAYCFLLLLFGTRGSCQWNYSIFSGKSTSQSSKDCMEQRLMILHVQNLFRISLGVWRHGRGDGRSGGVEEATKRSGGVEGLCGGVYEASR